MRPPNQITRYNNFKIVICEEFVAISLTTECLVTLLYGGVVLLF